MPAIRSQIIVGPARVVRGAGTVHVKEPFNVDLVKATTPIILDGYGKIDDRAEDIIATCSFIPDGRWNAATRAFLFPYINPTIGQEVFGASDTPTVIHDSNAHTCTIQASAVTKMPSLLLSASATMIGQVTITGVRKSGVAWSSADSLVTYVASGGVFTDAAFLPAEIKVQNYSAVWAGVTGLTTIQTETGWTVDFETDISFIKTDEIGTVKGILNSVAAMAKCTPLALVGADVTNALDIQSATSARGKSHNASYAGANGDLTITGADGSTIITLNKCGIVTAGFKFGKAVVRDGELGFVATRSFVAGVPGAICTLA